VRGSDRCTIKSYGEVGFDEKTARSRNAACALVEATVSATARSVRTIHLQGTADVKDLIETPPLNNAQKYITVTE